MSKYFEFEKKFGYSELIAIFAVILSISALYQSYTARKDTRAITKLDLTPNLRMDITFRENNSYKSYVVIENAGPVDAVQFEFQYSILQISSVGSTTGRASITGIEHPKKIENIGANKITTFPLPVPSIPWLIDMLKMKCDLNGGNVFETVISYRRESDLKQYAHRAFFFLNPEGQIVSEYDNSLPKNIYEPIIRAAYKSAPTKLLGSVHIDNLHPIENLDDPRMWHE